MHKTTIRACIAPHVFLLAVSLLMTGCANTIEGRDDNVFMPSLSVAKALGEDAPNPWRIELNLMSGTGHFAQPIDTQHQVLVNQLQAQGETAFDVDATISSGALRLAKPFMFNNNYFGMEWMFGLGVMRSDLDISSTQASRQYTHTALGPQAGFAFLLKGPYGLSLRAGNDLTLGTGLLQQYQRELIGVIAPSSSFEIMLGWRENYVSYHDDTFFMDVDLTFKGPAAGMRLTF